MEMREQSALAEKLLKHIDKGTTDLASAPYKQPVLEYTCPEIAQLEKTLFFRSKPLCVGASPIIKESKSYVTHDLTGKPIILTRNEQGKFQAFLNVCRHRGARVVEGYGKRNSFICPYHAWTYGMNGKLISRPEEECFSKSKKNAASLRTLPLSLIHI